MKKRWLGTIAALTVAVLAASAVPAFTADTGTIAVSIKAQAPAAPCLAVTPNSVDFGTHPFSTSNAAISQGDTDITIDFCGTAPGQNLIVSTTPATGPSGSWTPLSYYPELTIHPCPDANKFYLSLFLPFPAHYLTETPSAVLASIGGPPKVFPVGAITSRLSFLMPCQGSNGAGETKTLTATLTAVVA